MYADGYKNITNIDYSKTVIENMKLRCSDKPEMTCKKAQRSNKPQHITYHIGLEMDIRDLKFDNESFDAVIDKGFFFFFCEFFIDLTYSLLTIRHHGCFNVRSRRCVGSFRRTD